MLWGKMQYPRGFFFHSGRKPAANATAQATAATVSNPFSIQPRTSAASVPASAENQFPVAENTAGNVMAPSTA